MNLDKQLQTALIAINKASEIVIGVYHVDFIVNLKADNSVVTNADLASDKAIREVLLKDFSDYGILSEETKDDLARINKDYCWIVDPLDGTKDFVNRTDNFSINIALAYKNKIVLGVIAVPVKNIIYYATIGNGAYKIEDGKTTKIHVSFKKDGITMLTSLFFFKDQDKYNSLSFIDKMVACGSSYKAGLISEGKAEFCIKEDNKTKEWDTAPSDIIVKEAGGIMCDIYGNEMTYNKENFVNENGFIIVNCQELLNKVKK